MAWDSVDLVFYGLAGWRYDVELQVEYIIALASLLIPNMRDDFIQWLADAGTDTHTHIRRFGKMTVQNEIDGMDQTITFRPDKD